MNTCSVLTASDSAAKYHRALSTRVYLPLLFAKNLLSIDVVELNMQWPALPWEYQVAALVWTSVVIFVWKVIPFLYCLWVYPWGEIRSLNGTWALPIVAAHSHLFFILHNAFPDSTIGWFNLICTTQLCSQLISVFWRLIVVNIIHVSSCGWASVTSWFFF